MNPLFGTNLLFFFLLFVTIACDSECFDDCGENLLIFFLVLVFIFCNCCPPTDSCNIGAGAITTTTTTTTSAAAAAIA